MFIVYIYDSSKSTKFHELGSKYLFWRQNSTFDGELTQGQLALFKRELEELLLVNTGTRIILYEVPNKNYIKTNLYGENGGTSYLF